jgi:GT2 family glycosyltransferase
MRRDLVSVILVNWNSGDRLACCLQHLEQQSHDALEIVVVDNGSQDSSLEAAVRRFNGLRVLTNGYNAGFCRAFNQGLAITHGAYDLSLNADIWMQSDFVEQLVSAVQLSPQVGLACGKLLRGTGPEAGRRLDSTGLFLSRQRRPYDRGQGEADEGQYDGRREVFGACGAAWLGRRTMLEDVACEGEVLDEDFFVYYDDADLSWRAQWRGWRTRYQPEAVAWHERGGGDTLRKPSATPKHAFAQAHAITNRYLMVLKNDCWSNLAPALPGMLCGDLGRLGYVAVRRPALLRAYANFWRLRRRALHKRQIILAGRRVHESDMREWFR